MADPVTDALLQFDSLGGYTLGGPVVGEAPPQTPAEYLQSIEPGKDITPREFFGLLPSKYHMPGYLRSTGPEPDTTGDPRVWYTDPVLGAGTILPFPPGGRKTPPSSGYFDPNARLDAARRQLAEDKKLKLVKDGGGSSKATKVKFPKLGYLSALAAALAPSELDVGQSSALTRDMVRSTLGWKPGDPIFRDGDAQQTPLRGGYRSLIPISHTGAGVGGDEISELRDVMPWMSGEQYMEDRGFAPVTPVVTEKDLEERYESPTVFYTAGGPMPNQKQIDKSLENLDKLHRQAMQAGPITSQVSQALSDYAFGRDVQPGFQAIAELTEIDPTFNFEKYLDPTSQEVMDIRSQVESFAGIPTVQPGAATPWTPPAPFQDHLGFPSVTPDIVVPPPAEAPAPYVEQFEAFTPPEPEGPTAAERKADRAAAKEAAADKRASDRTIAKAAKASRKAEVKREAATKKRAQEQRDKLDSASKKALQDHMAWMATQTKRVAKEEKKRAKRYAGGKGGALMYT